MIPDKLSAVHQVQLISYIHLLFDRESPPNEAHPFQREQSMKKKQNNQIQYNKIDPPVHFRYHKLP